MSPTVTSPSRKKFRSMALLPHDVGEEARVGTPGNIVLRELALKLVESSIRGSVESSIRIQGRVRHFQHLTSPTRAARVDVTQTRTIVLGEDQRTLDCARVLVVHVALCALFIGPLRHTGIALATSLSSALNMTALMWLLRRRLGADIWRPQIFSSALQFVVCGGVMALCLLGLVRWMPFPAGAGLGGQAAWLALALAVGVLSYGAAHLVSGGRELRELRALLPGRAGGGEGA